MLVLIGIAGILFLLSNTNPMDYELKFESWKPNTDVDSVRLQQRHLEEHRNISFDINVATENETRIKCAYGFFAATKNHLIAAMVNIRRLTQLGRKQVDFVVLTNEETRGFCHEGVRFLPYDKAAIPSPNGYYVDCMVKLLFFNMTVYERVIYMDSDSLVLKSLDSLFDLPPVVLASPVAYWENEPCFTSALLVIQPDTKTWLRLSARMVPTIEGKRYDMDLLNVFYQHKLGVHAKTFPDVLLLPGYFLALSSHFRSPHHGWTDSGQPKSLEPFTDIDALANKTYVVHFSGQPKPWSLSTKNVMNYESISQYFYKYNLAFKKEFEAIENERDCYNDSCSKCS